MHSAIADNCSICTNRLDNSIKNLHHNWACTLDPTDAGKSLFTNVDFFFEDAFSQISRALRGDEVLPSWILRRKPNQPMHLRFNFVDSPLPNIATCLKPFMDHRGSSLPCSHCGFETRMIVLNIRFQVLCSHIISRLNSKEPNQKGLLEALFRPIFPYCDYIAPQTIQRELVWAGIGIILGHEIGHILYDPDIKEVNFTHHTLPPEIEKYVNSELDADRQAIRIVTAYSTSKSGFLPFLAAELVLRIASLTQQKGEDRFSKSAKGTPIIMPSFVPAPHIRWEYMQEIGLATGSLGLFDINQWENERKCIFDNWKEAVHGIV